MDEQSVIEGEASRPPRRRWRYWLLGLLLLFAAIAVAGYVGWRALPGYIVREAARRGVELEPGQIEVEVDKVILRDARFGLTGVRGLRGEARRATVDLDGRTPKRVRVEGLQLTLVGDEPLVDLPTWSERFAAATRPPVEASPVRISWSERPDAGPSASVVLEEATLALEGDFGALERARVIAFGEVLAEADGAARRVDVGWRVAKGTLAIGLGDREIAAAPVRLDLGDSAAPGGAATGAAPRLRITVAPLPLTAVVAAIAPALSRVADAKPGTRDKPKVSGTIIVEGSAELPLPRFEPGERIEGTMRATVRGWVPPHPRELDGLLFGDTTELSSPFALLPDRSALELGELEVVAGAMRLRGPASIRRVDTAEGRARAMVHADLSGAIPCSALARSAAAARLGKMLGGFAGDLATRSLDGNVLVRVGVEAELDRLDAARIDPTATLRCKLRLL